MLLLTAAWGAVRLLPFRWYAPLLGRQEQPLAADGARGADCASNSQHEVALAVGRGLRRGSRHLPWHATCLMRVMAGKVMLHRRLCPGTIYFGFDRAAGPTQRFHAWLRTGEVWVSGGREAPKYVVLAVFR